MSKKKKVSKSNNTKTNKTTTNKKKCDDDGVCPLDKVVTIKTAQESWGAILLRFLRLR